MEVLDEGLVREWTEDDDAGDVGGSDDVTGLLRPRMSSIKKEECPVAGGEDVEELMAVLEGSPEVNPDVTPSPDRAGWFGGRWWIIMVKCQLLISFNTKEKQFD